MRIKTFAATMALILIAHPVSTAYAQTTETSGPTIVKELLLWFHNDFGAARTGRLDITEINVLSTGDATALMSMKTLSGAPGKGRDGCVLINAPAKGVLAKGKLVLQPTIAPWGRQDLSADEGRGECGDRRLLSVAPA